MTFDVPVTIKLYDNIGRKVNETKSSPAGWYNFTGVVPGTYTLEFSLADDDNGFSNASSITGSAGVTVKDSGQHIDVGVGGGGLYYPDWTNDGKSVCIILVVMDTT